MPLYEYQCQDCGHRSDELQKLADAPLTVCPACGGTYKRLISAPAFQFKGSGWYVTDYARAGGGKPGEGKDGAAGTSASTDKPAEASNKEPAKESSKETSSSPSPAVSTPPAPSAS